MRFTCYSRLGGRLRRGFGIEAMLQCMKHVSVILIIYAATIQMKLLFLLHFRHGRHY